MAITQISLFLMNQPGQLVDAVGILSEGGLNLRCGPGQDYDILMVVPDGAEVIEEGWDNGWIYIRHDGQYGWVNSEYITPTGEVEN